MCYNQKRIRGGDPGDATTSPEQPFFKVIFNEYNFFIISNLVDNNDPYALKMRQQNVGLSYLVKDSVRKRSLFGQIAIV